MTKTFTLYDCVRATDDVTENSATIELMKRSAMAAILRAESHHNAKLLRIVKEDLSYDSNQGFTELLTEAEFQAA